MKYLLIIFYLFAFTNCASTNLPFKVSKEINPEKEHLKWEAHEGHETKSAQNFLVQRKNAIEHLLAPTIDPYKGEDSTPGKCQAKNLPKSVFETTNTGFVEFYSLYSSDRKILGFCGDPSRLLKTQYQVLYCMKSKAVYTIQYFYPTDMPWAEKAIASCK